MSGKRREVSEAESARLARVGALGGFSRAAKMTQEERSAAAARAGKASAERRRLEREARGEPHPKPSRWHFAKGPTLEELEPFLTEAARADSTLSEYLLRRQAIILYKQYLARIDVEGGAR